MTINRQKAWGWVGIAAFAAAGLFVLKDKSASQLGLAAAVFLVSLTIVGAAVVAAFLAREGLGRLWKRQFPPPPLWEKPRPVSALFEAELFAPLKPRLDLLEEDGRAALWRDRETGQFWSAFDWDFEFTQETIFTPIATREGWRGSADPPPRVAQ